MLRASNESPDYDKHIFANATALILLFGNDADVTILDATAICARR